VQVVNHVVKKYKKQSLLVLLLGGLTIVSVLIIVSLSLASGEFGRGRVSSAELCHPE
jgi:hypothetical protein